MGVIASKLGKVLSSFSKCPARIAMIGLDGAGKTTILYKFKLNETVPSIPTIGFNVETLTPVKGLTMTVWDMGGQERMRALWRMYLRGTDGVIFVIDSADKERVQEAKEELHRILASQELRGAPIVLVANKQDLPGALGAKEIIKRLNLHVMTDRQWVVQSACALTGSGIGEAMDSLAKLVRDFKSHKR